MQLPFSLEEFLGVFRAYNEAIGPAPLVLTALAIVLAVLAHGTLAWRHTAVTMGLAALWLWSGIVYHWSYFAAINPAAKLFGALFVLQGVLLITLGVTGNRLPFEPRHTPATVVGRILVAYALVVYPLVGWALGHEYPNGPTFGAPCPLTIYFFGMMLWTAGRIPVALIVIPVAWAIVGTSTALQLGMREDIGLPVAAVMVLVEVVRQRAHKAHSARPALGVG
jgi:hypothetical protein